MLIVYESISKGYAHLPFDTCILEIIEKIYNEETILFYGDCVHNSLLMKNIKSDSIKYVNTKIIDQNKKLRTLINEFVNLCTIKFKNRSKSNQIIFTNGAPHTMLFAKLLFPKNKLTFFVHGTLEELLHNKKIYQLGYYNKIAFYFRNDLKRIKYIVLGESIRQNALKILPNINDNLYSIVHPYKFDENSIKNVPVNQRKDIIKIGSIGTGSKAKNTDYIFQLENLLSSKVKNHLELYHIGSLADIDPPENTNVIIIGGKHEKLTEEEYTQNIKKLDYVLFFFSKDSYKLTASGALCDAISYGKPIIAIKNDYFEYINRINKSIGFLCEDINEIVNVIESSIIGHSYVQPKNYIEGLTSAIKYFSCENVEEELRRILE